MNRSLVFAVLAGATASSFACSSSKPSPAEPVDVSTPATSAEAPAAASAAASTAPAASASPSAAPNADAEEPPVPPFKGEAPAGGAKVTTKKAWVYWPNTLGIGLFDVKESSDAKTTLFEFASQSKWFTVPTAFVRPAPASKVAKGDLVWVAVVSKATCGRVDEVTDDVVKVSFLWGGKPSSKDADKDAILKLSGKLEYAAPVVVKQDDKWAPGVIAHSDKTTAWLAPYELAQEELKTELSKVRVMDVTKKRKKGDKVVACSFDVMGCIESTIIAPKEGGLAYEIALPADYVGPAGDGAKSTVVSACSISSIPK